jgi:putative membrane protein
MKGGWIALGLLVLAACWALIVVGMDTGSFSGHMLAHMGVVVIAAPLLAAGVAGTPFDVTARFSWLSPLPASLLEFGIVWLWHAPVMRRFSEISFAAGVLEQALFLIGGFVLWSTCFQYAQARRLSGVLALLLTSMHMTLLGVLLALAPRALYGTDDVTCLGVRLTAEQDQQAGGVIMLLFGAIAYLIGGLTLLAGYLRLHAAAQQEGR